MSRASSTSSTATLASAYSVEGSVLGVGSRAAAGAEAGAGGLGKQSLVWNRSSSGAGQGAASAMRAPQQPQQPQQPLCRFFGRGQGCSRGSACRFRHESPVTATDSSQLDPSLAALMLRAPSFGWADVAAAPGSGLGMGRARAAAAQHTSSASAAGAAGAAGLLRFGSGHSVLVLGDGDLTFSEALAAQAPAARLMASVQLSLSALVGRYAAAEGRLGRLAAAGVPVLLEMDARELHTYGTRWNQVRPSCGAASSGYMHC